jgi:hypothetical protein
MFGLFFTVLDKVRKPKAAPATDGTTDVELGGHSHSHGHGHGHGHGHSHSHGHAEGTTEQKGESPGSDFHSGPIKRPLGMVSGTM